MCTGLIHCCLYLCAVEGGYLRGLLEGTYLDFLYRICACCKIYLDTLYKVDTLASFIGQIDLLALCAVYADVLYRVSSTSRQHVYDTSTAEVAVFFLFWSPDTLYPSQYLRYTEVLWPLI
jgi:hypothetical protein